MFDKEEWIYYLRNVIKAGVDFLSCLLFAILAFGPIILGVFIPLIKSIITQNPLFLFWWILTLLYGLFIGGIFSMFDPWEDIKDFAEKVADIWQENRLRGWKKEKKGKK